MSTAPLRVVGGKDAPNPKSIEAELRDLLRREASLARKLTDVRAAIGPAKRTYQEKHKTFGLSNEALKHVLGVRG